MSTLESRGYVATDDDIRAIAGGFLEALSSANGSRLDYLKCLVGTTKHEVRSLSRSKGSNGKLNDETQAQHLAALEKVHKHFYGVVLKTTKDKLAHLPSTGGKRGDEVARRTNYARTAMYSIRHWVRAGNDITTLVPAKVTKAALEVEGKRRKPSASRLATRAGRQSKQLLSTFRALASADREAALHELEGLLKKLAALELAGTATKDPRQAAADNRPLRVGGTVFMPAGAA